MATRSKIKRVHLDLNDKHESSFLGVVSAEPDYKLAYLLNQHLDISLKSAAPVSINNKSDKKITFSRFSDVSHAPYLVYDLISNRSGKNILFRKLINIDYILQVHDLNTQIDLNKAASTVRNIEFVTAVFKLDESIIKDKNLIHLLIH